MSDLDPSFQSHSVVHVHPGNAPTVLLTVIRANYIYVALATVLVYHSVISLGQEVRFFWQNPRNSVSLIYFANRLIGFLAAIFNIASNTLSENFENCAYLLSNEALSLSKTKQAKFRHGPKCFAICSQCYWLNTSWLSACWRSTIKVSKTFAENGVRSITADKKLGIFLKAFLTLIAGNALVAQIRQTIYEGNVLGIVTKGVSICAVERIWPERFRLASWVLPVLYGITLLGLALYKSAQHWRLSHGFKGLHLVRVLVRDQVIYQGFMICYIVLLSLQERVNPYVGVILTAFCSPTILCIFGGQLLMNLKEAGERGENGGLNYTAQSVSDIEFA